HTSDDYSALGHDDIALSVKAWKRQLVPMPTFCTVWKTLPSVLIEGAMMISVCWNSGRLRAPTLPMQVVIAPTRFWLPSSTSAGPKRICFNEPVAPTLMRVPRGRLAGGGAMPQWYPLPGASGPLAKALPTMTASAPHASALQTSPPLLIPPSVMIGTYRDVFLKSASRAAAQSTVAVTWGTPSPSTPREVQAAPGPTPTNTAAGPHSIISRVTSYPTVFPTITGIRISRQNFSRSSDLYSDEM